MAVGMWFDDTFLPSLFERAGSKRMLWITYKQYNVCKNHMTSERYSIDTPLYGVFASGFRLQYLWNGRRVTVYQAPNGAAQIYFGQDEAEKTAMDKRCEYKKMAFIAELRRRHPNKYKEKLKAAEDEYAEALAWLDYVAASDDEDEEVVRSVEDVEDSAYQYYILWLA